MMMKLRLYNMQGQNIGDVEVADEALELKRGAQAVKDEITAHLARSRAGSASTLGKSEISASRKKPWRQKGLGRARAGYRASPVWRGGGIAFGPKPRDYAIKLPRKAAALAFRRALSEKLASGNVAVLEDLKLEGPRTRVVAALLKQLNLKTPLLLITETLPLNLKLACRNMRAVELIAAADAHVYALVRHRNVLVTRAALNMLTERMQKG